ncbi:hypothetical protein [Polyangium jinanense]|uniref:Secreted protein n=1 Tax=Polyangium jinanense TaxID=2829994 RepID=A0A9X3X7W8_9BACT|nr:hypothetical protein [Polyangium jinanense]MDC3954353.1 hypothetical protein [Polyangium jinanense]MDC3984195.1 hypothetical protein [Polyangium jinanense]
MRAKFRSHVLALGAALGWVVLGTPPSMAAQPEGSCPPGWELWTVRKLVNFAAPRFEDAIRGTDNNDDNFLCVKFDKRDPRVFTYIDNSLPEEEDP